MITSINFHFFVSKSSYALLVGTNNYIDRYPRLMKWVSMINVGEFLAMPLKKLNHRSTTKVSAYDRSEMKRLSQTVFIAKPNGEIVLERPAKKLARSNKDQVSCKRR